MEIREVNSPCINEAPGTQASGVFATVQSTPQSCSLRREGAKSTNLDSQVSLVERCSGGNNSPAFLVCPGLSRERLPGRQRCFSKKLEVCTEQFTGRTDAEAEALILWSPDAKSQLVGKDPVVEGGNSE